MLRIDAGRYCENRWREIALQTALKKEEKREQSLKRFSKVRNIQGRIPKDIALKQRRTRTVRDTLKEVHDDINAVLPSRVRRLKLKRPKGSKGESTKAVVIAEAVVWFKERWGITVTPYRMRRFWDEHRRSL